MSRLPVEVMNKPAKGNIHRLVRSRGTSHETELSNQFGRAVKFTTVILILTATVALAA
jgi:hypothetical protein